MADASNGITSDASSDSPTDSAIDGGDAAVCPSIQQACPADGGSDASAANCALRYRCVLTWSDAQQPSAWCPHCAGYEFTSILPDCDGFNLVVTSGTDTAVVYYYDKQSGQLTGIEFQGDYITTPNDLCVAGHVSGVTTIGCADSPYAAVVCPGDVGDAAPE
jgi:hypothetical protein